MSGELVRDLSETGDPEGRSIGVNAEDGRDTNGKGGACERGEERNGVYGMERRMHLFSSSLFSLEGGVGDVKERRTSNDSSSANFTSRILAPTGNSTVVIA